MFDFLTPGLLGSAKRFQAFVSRLHNRRGNDIAPLRRLAGPYILRRLKTDRSIITDLLRRGFAGPFIIELAIEEGTPQTRDVVENNRRSAEYLKSLMA